jgi:hypothetical protein
MPFAASGNRRTVFALLAALAAFPLTAGAEGPTVKVGKETKKTVGTITELQAGDVACYITLKDDQGAEFTELGDFEVCENQSLVGKRVTLTYELGNVMADECEGNPDCTKSKTVALVKTARPVAAPAAGKAQTSFCSPAEAIVFECRLGAKLVSVCASKDASPTRGTLRYRFGKPGSPLELELPATPTVPRKAANGETVAFSGGGGAWLRFHKGEYAYVTYTGIGHWGPKGEPRIKEGVLVERGGKRVANLPCTSKLTSDLSQEWFDRTGVESHGEELEYPE